jgi:hypothetical protein
MGVVAQKMEDDGGAGTKYQDNAVTKHVGGVGMKKVKDENGNEMTEEELSVNILEKAGVGERDGNEGFNIRLDANDSGSFVKDYEALKNAATEMRS